MSDIGQNGMTIKASLSKFWQQAPAEMGVLTGNLRSDEKEEEKTKRFLSALAC